MGSLWHAEQERLFPLGKPVHVYAPVVSWHEHLSAPGNWSVEFGMGKSATSAPVPTVPENDELFTVISVNPEVCRVVRQQPPWRQLHIGVAGRHEGPNNSPVAAVGGKGNHPSRHAAKWD